MRVNLLQDSVRTGRGEQGTILLMMMIVLSTLLLIAGLAVDAGNLYRARINLQNAVDAASLAGIGYTVDLGKFELDQQVIAFKGRRWSNRAMRDQYVADFLTPRTNEVAYTVMDEAGFPHKPGGRYQVEITNSFNSPDLGVASERAYAYNVIARRRIDFFLIDLIPGVNDSGSLVIEASATAERKVATIVTYIDVSDSMNCPATGSCDCLMVPGNGPCPAGGATKMDGLVDAMIEFGLMFDPARDRLYAVPFNARSTVFSLRDYVENNPILGDIEDLTEAQVRTIMNSLRGVFNPKSSTNLCDALMRGRKRLADDSLLDDRNVNHVIFSDGAPTAGRFLFARPKDTLPAWDISYGGVYDYSHYAVQWRDAANPGTFNYGPSILMQTDLLGMNLDDAHPPAPGSGEDDLGRPSAAGWASCSVKTNAEPLREVGSAAEKATVSNQVFNPCLHSLASHLPGESGKIYGGNYNPGGGKTFANFQDMYYNCAIALTDQFRAQNHVVHAIGLGQSATYPRTGNTLNDPYQVATDTSLRHDIFNSRLAADALRAAEPEELPAGVPVQPYPEFSYDGYDGYSQFAGGKNTGTYYPTPDTAQLRLLFKQIAQQILMRLSE